MTKKMSIEYDPDDIPKLRDIVKVQFMEIQDKAYQQGTDAERERIIKVIQDVVAEHQARGIQNVPSLLLVQLIRKGQEK
jgi:hypothetical protein